MVIVSKKLVLWQHIIFRLIKSDKSKPNPRTAVIINNVLVRMWEKWSPSTSWVWMWISATMMEKSMEIPQTMQNRTTLLSGNSIRYISKENQNIVLKIHLHSYVYFWITIHKCQEMKKICVHQLMSQ
jgi:hypothetical protein